MAQRGRKPKPVGAKQVAGNPGGRSLTPMLPKARSGTLAMPKTVANNERARGYWDLFIENTGRDHLTPMDAPLLGRLCIALALADEAGEALDAAGPVIRSPTDQPVQNPYLPIVNRQTEIARKLAAELGLTVAQRNRTGAPMDPGDDPHGIFDA